VRNLKVVLMWVWIVALLGVLAFRVQGAMTDRDDEQKQERAQVEQQRREREDRPDGATTAPVELGSQDYERGDCVTWDQGGGRVEPEVVNCAEPHLIEMIEPSVVDQGADAPYPNPRQWLGLIDELCRPVAVAYLDGRLDPRGRLGASAVYPLEDGWRSGIRRIWCGVLVRDPLDVGGGDNVAFEGAARDVDQANLLRIGACVHYSGTTVVPCREPHHAVVTAHLDLSDLSERPSDEQLQHRCDEADAGVETAPSAVATFIGFEPDSWTAGTRKGTCMQMTLDQAGDPILQKGTAG
jgi:hypothetical protein